MRRLPACLRLAISLLGLVPFFPSVTQALVVPRAAVSERLARAVLVGEIEVDRIDIEPDPRFFARRIATVTLKRKLDERDDGGWFPAEGDSFRVVGLGGEVGTKGVFYAGMPRPYLHGRYRAYLERSGGRDFQVTGFDEGLQAVTAQKSFSRNRTDGSNGDGQGAYLYWADSYFPVPYFIAAPSFAGHPDFVAAIDASFQTWRNIEDIKVEFLPMGCSTATRDEDDGLNNVILIRNNWGFDPSAIAITRNFYLAEGSAHPGMILDTDILLNGADHDFTTTNEAGKYDVQDIVTHESGHFLGLGHERGPNLDPDATMYADAEPDETIKRTLHPDDLAGIRSAYLGVGNKLGPMTSPCAVQSATSSSGSFGCAAVHGRSPWGLAPALAFLALLFAAGRRYMKQGHLER